MSSMNPYQSAAAESYVPFAIEVGSSERAEFIRRTYAHLAGAVLALVGLEALIFTLVPEETLLRLVGGMLNGYNWLLVMGAFMVVSWIANSWAVSATSLSKQYMGLGLYVIAEAAILLPLLVLASRFGGQDVIPTAGLLTALIFIGLTAFVFVTKVDLSGFGPYLMVASLCVMGYIIASVVFGFSGMGVVVASLMVGLSAGYILYYTSNVLHQYRTDQYVAAALALFASVVLLFWYILQLLMSLSSRD